MPYFLWFTHLIAVERFVICNWIFFFINVSTSFLNYIVFLLNINYDQHKREKKPIKNYLKRKHE
jgi:hypothetical protein